MDFENGGCYHLISRCVRRAFLCGIDRQSGKNFDHRRQWIENRILALGNIFAVSVYGYAVMSNHYHIVVKVDPTQVWDWPDELVVEKWLQLCPSKSNPNLSQSSSSLQRAQLLSNPDRLRILRCRLGSLSWFMRFINEPLARIANREDQCTGRFWEGRFKSQALLDDSSLLACMVYVDLNPVRARIAEGLKDSSHTSVSRRITYYQRERHLEALTKGAHPARDIPISLKDYLALIRVTINQWQGSQQGVYEDIITILKPHGLDHKTFTHYYTAQHTHWQRAMGSVDRLKSYILDLGIKYVRTTKKPILIH